MLWWQNNNTYQETIKELESVHSSDDLITHAAVTADKCMMVLPLKLQSRQLTDT